MIISISYDDMIIDNMTQRIPVPKGSMGWSDVSDSGHQKTCTFSVQMDFDDRKCDLKRVLSVLLWSNLFFSSYHTANDS